MTIKVFIRRPFLVALTNNLLSTDLAVMVSLSSGAINFNVMVVVLNLDVGITLICKSFCRVFYSNCHASLS